MEEQHQRIIRDSIELFFKYGIKSMTMDDVSRDLGISKKTLYKYVVNKADLVDQGVKTMFSTVTNGIRDIGRDESNAIEDLFEIDQFFDSMSRQQHPGVMFQLGKYYPDTFKWLEQRKSDFVVEITEKNLKKGMKQGLYRKDLNIAFICFIYVAHTYVMTGESGVPLHVCESPEFHKHHLEYHVRGIASIEGLEFLNKRLNNH